MQWQLPNQCILVLYDYTTDQVRGHDPKSQDRSPYSSDITRFHRADHTQDVSNAKESIEYGTNIVGGVKPGFTGEHLGLPVLPTVKEAMEKLKPDASAVYVPGDGASKAIMDAIEAEVPLIVAVAEHVPIHDILKIHQMLDTTSKTRLVGANCAGIINTHGRCRLGFMPLPVFKTGKVGIVAKSGTLSYETVASTTRAGLGQSYCISVGGDIVPGTTFVDALKVFEEDDKTEGIILIGELGGTAELDAANWILEYRDRTQNPKPVMAIVGGVEAPPGRIMGHAGAWATPGEPTAREKIEILEQADVVVVDHPEKFGDGMKTLLTNISNTKGSAFGTTQKRGFHSMQKRATLGTSRAQESPPSRSLHIKRSQAFDILKGEGLPTADQPTGQDERLIAISIDRTSRRPCIITSPTGSSSDAQRHPFEYESDPSIFPDLMNDVSQHLNLNTPPPPSLLKLIKSLTNIFFSREAIALETKFTLHPTVSIHSANFNFDDAAFRSAGRQTSTHSLRDPTTEEWSDLEAEKFGMVYIKLSGPGSIGTIVNGAGLAMNTVDALINRGGTVANFCDTGGKATSSTIKNAFRIVTSDSRVKVIFVNIYGGLTRGDMIAQGVIEAFTDLDLNTPVVVRLRGTNEKSGQEIIQKSGLRMDSFDGFEDAAKRVIGLVKGEDRIG
ncbi:putative succinylligase alpha-chain [Phaeomoniella chlamydospora]|uniref:Putative succinylligase alpha-chain n=1 Tax=Phaeomoniella chlamydospora TaxID=158046 RepID=A0A0G2F312_PHACM|nr:putative succinylligase alpha-chain [Phaeomoniella chlamydospora]